MRPLSGTPMRSYGDSLKPDQLWDLVYYVLSLSRRGRTSAATTNIALVTSFSCARHHALKGIPQEQRHSACGSPMRPLLATVVAAASLTPQRGWLERLAFVVPGPAASRWLLLADAVCLVALGFRTRRPILGVPFALGLGFIVLNGLGLALTDFYLALTAFHLAVGTAMLAVAGRSRWLGGGLIALAIVLGVLT